MLREGDRKVTIVQRTNMKRRRKSLLVFLTLFFIFWAAGCSQRSGSGFLRKEFLEYKSVAVLRFEGDNSGEVSKAFASHFQERFPEISILGGKVFLDNFKRERFDVNQLNEETRSKIGKTIGAQALITGTIYSPGISSWFLQIKIIDTETGKVMGRSTVEIDSLFSVDIEKATHLAVEKLSLW
jgi:hypothetical protein